MNRDPKWILKERYERLKGELINPNFYPFINTILNLPAFVKENQGLYLKLINQLKQLRKQAQNIPKREVKIKTTPFYVQNLLSSGPTVQQQDVLSDLREKNEILRTSIAKLREQRSRKAALEAPVLKQKQRELEERKQQLQKLTELNKQLKRAVQTEEVLELYEIKCRECESLRGINNSLSEQLKGIIEQVNKLSGSQQNPNMFLLSLGIR